MMTTVVLGTNNFEDCSELLALRESLLLQIAGTPPAVTLIIPEDDPSLPPIRVVQNVAEGQDAVTVRTTESSVFLLYQDHLLLTAIMADENKIMATLDLRPLGLRVFTTASALMVKDRALAENRFVRGRAINLA